MDCFRQPVWQQHKLDRHIIPNEGESHESLRKGHVYQPQIRTPEGFCDEPAEQTIKFRRAKNTAAQPRRKWSAAKLPKDESKFWDWCLKQKQPVLIDLLAFCAASSLNTVITKTETSKSADFGPSPPCLISICLLSSKKRQRTSGA
jgi:hypothetical protein